MKIAGAIHRFSVLKLACLVLLLIGSTSWLFAAEGTERIQMGAEKVRLMHRDLSIPLREMIPTAVKAGVKRVVPNRPIPVDVDHAAPVKAFELDSVLQMNPGFSAPTPGSANWLGIGNGFSGPQGTWTVNVAPPDTVMDVGPNHLVQAVNSGLMVMNKNGSVAYGPVNINTLWSGFGGGCQSNNDGDPTINYDQMADRWVIMQFSVSTTPYLQCVAVSQTGDPTGSWYRFSYSFTDFNDYPKVGIWPDGYYVTYNMFTATSGYGKVCALDRSKLITGAANTQQCFNTSTNIQGLLPSDLDGTTQPPAGSPNFVVRFGSNNLQLWKFHVDWVTSANSTFTGPTNISVAAFTPSCNAATRGACVPQLNGGTSYYLEALADRLMNRLAYRNFGDHEALTVAHSIMAGSTGANVRWYELRTPNATPTVFQSGSYGPDSNWRWVASTAMDRQGNMAMGYSVSSSSISPSIRITGRLASDAAGTMGSEVDILNSVTHASQIGTYGNPAKPLQRWGDYSAMVVDPADDCTFWYTTEYIPTQGIFNWATRIASFKFDGCAATADFGISANPASMTINRSSSGNSTVTISGINGFAGTVSFSTSGLPSGVTASYSPTTVTGSGTSTLTLSASSSATIGNATVTVVGTSGALSHGTTINLTVNDPTIPQDLTATYNATTKAPVCGSNGKSCSSGTLLTGRGTMSPAEVNQPNTINTSCADGNSGTFHSDESLDSLKVQTNDGTALAGGKSVTVTAVAWCWGSADNLDLYYTSNSASPSWTLIGTQNCGTTAGALKTFTATYTLPTGATLTSQAVRGTFRYNGSASACGTNSGYDDHDDLVFGVSQAAPTPDFSISAAPTSVAVTQGSSGTSTITIGALNGFTGSVAFSTTGLPTGVTASYSPATVTGSGNSTLTLSASGSAATGAATVTVTGTSGSLTHSATINLTVNPAPVADFTISRSQASVTIMQGASGNNTITISGLNGFAGTVSFSTSGLPSGVTAAYAPTTVTGSGTSTLTLTASASAAVGTVTITVTGTSGSLVHTTTFSLTVNSISIPDLTATYNSTYKTPACGTGGKSCDTGATLVNGRGTMTSGNELNRPNTIASTCVDGNSGTYHVDESIDRMKVATNDGTAFASGKAVTITFTTYCYDATDRLDVYYTANATTPSWVLIGTQSCTAAGVKTFTASYTLPATLPAGATVQAVRGNFRYGGSAGSCSSGNYNDRDDLVFGVQ